MVFRRLVCRRPDIAARQIDVLPTERREVGEKVVGNVFDLAQDGNRAVQIAGVPQDDRGDEEVQAGGAMLLIFGGAVANFSEPMDEDGARQAVARLAPIEATARLPRGSRVLHPMQTEP